MGDALQWFSVLLSFSLTTELSNEAGLAYGPSNRGWDALHWDLRADIVNKEFSDSGKWRLFDSIAENYG